MLKTPETHPDHHTVGHYLKGHGVVYYCESYDTEAGYNLKPVFGEDPLKREIACVSEAAIGRTFHLVYIEGDYMYCQHTLTPEQREFLKGKQL